MLWKPGSVLAGWTTWPGFLSFLAYLPYSNNFMQWFHTDIILHRLQNKLWQSGWCFDCIVCFSLFRSRQGLHVGLSDWPNTTSFSGNWCICFQCKVWLTKINNILWQHSFFFFPNFLKLTRQETSCQVGKLVSLEYIPPGSPNFDLSLEYICTTMF